MTESHFSITGSTLKIIAIISMILDHVGAVLINAMLPEHPELIDLYYFLRYCGRIAFPIFCFLLVEGFMHTKNIKKYALRLGAFALISEIPFDLAFHDSYFYMDGQNVFFTLFIGLIVIWIFRYTDSYFLNAPFKQSICRVLFLLAGMFLAWVLNTDYDYFGVIIIAVFYEQYHHRLLASLCSNLFLFLMNTMELTSFISVPLIQLYNGKRGLSLKYIFYVFYPLHLLVLYAIWKFLLL